MCDFTQAARETGALKEAKDKLEKQVEEITWRLQLEKRLRVIIICCEGQLFLLASCSQMSLFLKKEKRKKNSSLEETQTHDIGYQHDPSTNAPMSALEVM